MKIVTVISLVLSVAALGIAFYAVNNIDTVKGDQGEQGIQGEQGEQGSRGLQGVQGVQGIIGVQGVKGDKGVKGDVGKDAVVDLNILASKVEAIINPPVINPIFSTNNGDGNFAPTFAVTTAKDYTFKFTHFGAGEFDVSLVNADGDVDVLVNSNGHLQMTKVVNLSVQTYTLRVSASGDWTISVK